MPGLDDPTTTAEKRLARWTSRLDWEALGERGPVLVPGLDARALSRKYGMEAAARPQLIECTFKVPFGVSRTPYLRYRKRALVRMVQALDKMGYDLVPEMGIRVEKGMYPAVDLRDGKPDPDRREMRILAYFRFRKPEPVRIELPPELLAPRVVQG